MNSIDIFLISYLIFSFLLSFLISFLFLRKYRNLEPRISSDKFPYYYCMFNFAIVLFYILLVIVDYTISTFEISVFEGTLIISFSKFLPNFYCYFSLFSMANSMIICPIIIYYETTGYYKDWDIFCDVVCRFFTEFINLTNLKIGGAVLVIFIAIMIPFHEWILAVTKIDSMKSFFSFAKLLNNYRNFLKYFTILFYIGFAIQNVIRIDSVNRSESEKENFYLWRLGKVFLYYFKESSSIEYGYNLAKEKYDEYLLNNLNDDQFKANWDIFQTKIENIMKNKLIEAKLDKVQEVSEKYIEEVRKEKGEQEKIINNVNNNENNIDNKIKNEIEEDKNNINDDIKKINEIIKKEKDKYINDKNIIKKLFCCCKKKNKNEFEIFKENTCHIMTKVYEEALKLFRKSYLIDCLAEKLIKPIHINCCRHHYCIKTLWFIFLFILILLEIPWAFDKLNSHYSFIDFILTFLIFLCVVLFYFSIFIYSLINHEYIKGELIFGENLSENVNYIKFLVIVLNLFNAAIYHSFWVLNKRAIFKAKYLDVFILPEKTIDISIMDFNFSINTLDLVIYGSLIIIIISLFNASKFTKYNENADFFFSDNEFYLYFFLGCACYVDILENPFKFNKNKDKFKYKTDLLDEKEINLFDEEQNS
jgi:hypothetical protein